MQNFAYQGFAVTKGSPEGGCPVEQQKDQAVGNQHTQGALDDKTGDCYRNQGTDQAVYGADADTDDITACHFQKHRAAVHLETDFVQIVGIGEANDEYIYNHSGGEQTGDSHKLNQNEVQDNIYHSAGELVIDALPEKPQALAEGENRIHRRYDIEVAAQQRNGKQIKGIVRAPYQSDKGIHQLEQTSGAEAGDPKVYKI